jgi:hypothetical protein
MQDSGMIFAHKTLHPDCRVVGIAALYDAGGRVVHLAVAQGTAMHIIDINEPGYPITQSYPFHSPILAIAPAGQDGGSVFVLLRNHNWLIFCHPRLCRFGTLDTSNRPHRSILKRASPTSHHRAASTPIATATVNATEDQICYAVCPSYVALHVRSNAIDVIPLHDDAPSVLIPVLESNIVDIGFVPGRPMRLAYLGDSANGRILHVVALGGRPVFSASLRSDAHSILAVNETALIVFTHEGIARVTNDDSIARVEYLATFWHRDGIVLHHCHFYDNVYLLCDSCGSLMGGLFTNDGRPRTEFIRNVGPASAVAVIDRRHLVVASPFGDSVIYESNLLENAFTLGEVGRIAATGPVLSMSTLPEGILCATGRGETGALRWFERSLSCKHVGEIPANGCLAVFSAMSNDVLYVCLCFGEGTKVIVFDGGFLTPVTWDFLSETVILFAEVATGFLVVTDNIIRVIDPSTGRVIVGRTFRDATTAAAVSPVFLVVADEASGIRVLNVPDLSSRIHLTITR